MKRLLLSLAMILTLAVPAFAAEDIVIGGSIPMTGVFAFAGVGINAGIQDYVKITNDAGGIKGRKLFMPIRIATTRSMVGPGIGEAMELMGKDTVMKHLDLTLKQLSEAGIE